MKKEAEPRFRKHYIKLVILLIVFSGIYNMYGQVSPSLVDKPDTQLTNAIVLPDPFLITRMVTEVSEEPELVGSENTLQIETTDDKKVGPNPTGTPGAESAKKAVQPQQALTSQADNQQVKSESVAEKPSPVTEPAIQEQVEESMPLSQELTEEKEEYSPDLNSFVLDVISTYEIGKYPYLLNNDYANYNGVTTNIVYQGTLLAKAHPSGNRASHCVGITFEVFVRAMRERNKTLGISQDDFNGMSADDLREFMLTWYVANGSKNISNIVVAAEKYGVGTGITRLEDAKPGDFVDISRENGTGHTTVFINWVKENNKIIGIKYWSSQGAGINYKTEYFNVADSNGRKYGNVRIDLVYIARVLSVQDYKRF
ncbi:MAG: hypothetical protein KGZ63_12650 [Clostridiales bacterium]|nr:hypothetical protein [Clostridiales bacterium]